MRYFKMIGAAERGENTERMIYEGSPLNREKRDEQFQAIAFVLFRPKSKVTKEELSYNEAALRILTFLLPPSKVISGRLSGISAFCSKWAKSLEKRRTEHKSSESLGPETDLIDIILSGRRWYKVGAFVLAQEKQKRYLFILERTSFESAS